MSPGLDVRCGKTDDSAVFHNVLAGANRLDRDLVTHRQGSAGDDRSISCFLKHAATDRSLQDGNVVVRVQNQQIVGSFVFPSLHVKSVVEMLLYKYAKKTVDSKSFCFLWINRQMSGSFEIRRRGAMAMTAEVQKRTVLQARGISKHYGGVKALDDVDLELREGEVLAIVGDNGAGKSTLIKAITGAISRTSGSIHFDGREVQVDTPSDAKAAGIETVYQDLALVNELSITKNVFLGREIIRDNIFGRLFGVLDFKKMDAEIRALFARLDIRIADIYRDAQAFSGGQRQAVALSKTVMFGKRIAILDEPTAALGVRESRMAMDLVASLKDHGLSVIMITHNMQHVLNYCDRVMVLRLGRVAAVRAVSDVDGDTLVGLITGASEAKVA